MIYFLTDALIPASQIVRIDRIRALQKTWIGTFWKVCCRYYYEDFERELRELLKSEKVTPLPDFTKSSFGRKDIHPSDTAVILHGTGKPGAQNGSLCVSEMAWGFSNPINKGLIINARAETAREKR